LDKRVQLERLRVARELHDDLGQILMALKLELDMARQMTNVGSSAASNNDLRSQLNLALGRASRLVTQAEQAMREAVWGLRADDSARTIKSFDELARRLRDSLESWGEREHWVVRFESDRGSRPPHAAGVVPPLRGAQVDVLLRTAQEALRNVARHGRARHVWMRLSRLSLGWEVDIRDDGRGLPPGLPDVVWGHGLHGLQERLDALGGRLRVSNHEQGGCQVSVFLPDGSHSEKFVT